MIQDLGIQSYDNTYRQIEPRDEDCIVIFREREVLVQIKKEETILPTYRELKAEIETLVYLFAIDDRRYYLAQIGASNSPKEYHFEPIRLVRTMQPKGVAFATMTAFHLFNWYRINQYCGCCQSKLRHSKKVRALSCDKCGNRVFPRISPAIIVGITDGDKLLMTKYAGREYKKYALVAGFCEIGESAERTVEREVMEEVGLKVKNIRYYKSQPWGLAGDLLLGYFAEVDEHTQIRLDEQELSEAVWVKREAIDFEADEVTLTSEMIMHFKHKIDKE